MVRSKNGCIFSSQVSCITLQICDDDPLEVKEHDDSARITGIDKVCLTPFSFV